MRRALITGITGQDGSYLAEHLLDQGYDVHGVVRRVSSDNTSRIDHLLEDRQWADVRLHLHHGDLADGSQLSRLVRTIQPDEVYNLGAQSHVAVSFQQPEYTGDVNALGVVRLLEAIRNADVDARFYQAGTSEMFGDAPAPQNEQTPFRPRSPYAAAKVYGYWATRNYREAYGMYAVNGILFNHESERRGETFVTRKITRGVARIVAGLDEYLYLGNLDAVRDWGHARDYVRSMRLMLQQDGPADYVIGTGQAHTVREFCQHAFAHVGLDWEPFVRVDPAFNRPTDTQHLRADAAAARRSLGWEPRVTFDQLVTGMLEHDLRVQVGLDLEQAREKAAHLQPTGGG